MSRHPRLVPLVLALALAATAGGCDDTSPTDPASGALAAPPLSANRSATVERQHFSFPFGGGPGGAQIAAPCLDFGGPLTIQGTVSGWVQVATTADGHVHGNEFLDFSGLTASGGGWSWDAAPGAHEIWSTNLGTAGDHALNIIHEGHSHFVGQGDAPDFELLHRIHQVLTAELALAVNEITPLSVRCLGSGG